MNAIRNNEDKNNESKFIEEINFYEDFPPFKKKDKDNEGDKLKFNGQKQVQDLIKIYFETKGVTDYKINAERFKISCLLGSNGGGKSRLFEWVYNFFNRPNIGEPYGKKYIGKITFNNGNDIEFKDNSYFYDDEWKSKVNPLVQNKGELKELEIISDNFFKLDVNMWYSVNNYLFQTKNYNNFYYSLFKLLENNELGIKEVIVDYLNLEKGNYKTELTGIFNSNWHENFGGKHIYFSETYNKEENRGFINESLNFDQVLTFFKKLRVEIENSIISENGIDKAYLEKLWFSLSDLFMYLVNESRGKQLFTTSNPNSFFITKDGYKDFRTVLELLQFYLFKIEEYDLGIKYFEEQKPKDNFLSKDLKFLDVNDFDKLKLNLKNTLKIFDCLEDENENMSEKLAKENFNQSLHNFLRRCSGYEYSYVYASEYFILELLSGFTLKSDDTNRKYGQNFQNFIYYGIRNTFNKELSKYNLSISSIGNLEDLISLPILSLDIKYSGGGITKRYNQLSAGEKTIISRFINIYEKILDGKNKGKTNFIILIDEPDLHLHLDWQRKYIQKLIDVFSTLPEEISIHFIIATHSPFIISDLPGECIVKLQGDGKGNTKISYMDKKNKKTFGANFIDLIQDGFFFEHKNLMGSFAENVIGGLADEEREKIFNGKSNNNPIKNNIGDDFLRQNLAYFHKKENEEN